MDPITLILIALLIVGMAILIALITPPLYAWADRWLDRTHDLTAPEDGK